MTRSRSKTDWTDMLLYGGIFLLLIVFLFQLLKLWNNGSNSVTSFLSSIPQALSNTLAAVENGLASAITSPFTWLASLFENIPSFFSLLFTFITGLLNVTNPISGIVSGITALGVATGASNATTLLPSNQPTNQSQGSSYPATVQGAGTATETPVGNLNGFSYTLPST